MDKPPQSTANDQKPNPPPERHNVWFEENAIAIAAYNERVDRDGLSNEGLRRF